MTPNEKSERSKQVLGDPIIAAAFADIRLGLVSRLEQLPMADRESQHEIALTLQLLKQLKLQIESYGQDAVVEKHRQQHDSFITRMREKLA
jgi:hypothetical protein